MQVSRKLNGLAARYVRRDRASTPRSKRYESASSRKASQCLGCGTLALARMLSRQRRLRPCALLRVQPIVLKMCAPCASIAARINVS